MGRHALFFAKPARKEVREPPAAHVGDDSRWRLEEDEPGVEQKEAVDPRLNDGASVCDRGRTR
jgi:hypothetical protein